MAGKLNLRSFKGRQCGGGIAGMYSKKPYLMPVNPHTTEEKTNEIVGKHVTPKAAVEERDKKINRGNARKYSTCSGRQY